MATLVMRADDGDEKRFPVFKSLTTIGSDPDVDVCLSDQALAPVAAHIAFDGTHFTIASTDSKREIYVSGKAVLKQTLVDGDDVVIASARLRFALDEKKAEAPKSDDEAKSMQAYKRLLAFSRRLGEQTSVPELLNALMDEIIQLTEADKGFLVLLDDAGEGKARVPHIKVARNIAGENLNAAVSALSDTIVAKVVQTREPIVVSDALHSTEFNSSLSVVNLKLTSVMCAPLLHQGEVFGVIYVGNNSVVNLFDESSLELLTIFCGAASLLVQNALHVDALTLEKEDLKSALESKRYGSIIGACEGMKQVYKKIDKVSKADISVLVTGETGTGKELFAAEIHNRSPRAKKPFVVINCGAIPENLLESELFGHVKGAFTGAVQTRVGRFQAADGGTLFLDEIGEMPLHLQVKILRAIQERVVTKVGDHKGESIDIRVIAATHRNLEKEVAEGRFREDLYYRLNVVNLRLPPLRERDDDVIVIANFLLEKYREEYSKKAKGFSKAALVAMRSYGWPGNVRQLENRLKRAVVLCEKGQITPEDLDITSDDLTETIPLSQAVERFRKRYINESLARNGDNRTKTARELGVDPRTIFRHLEAKKNEEA